VPLLPVCLMALTLAVACVLDGRERRIPNALTMAALALGLLVHAWLGFGPSVLVSGETPTWLERLRESVLGAGLMLLLGLLLWRVRLFGAGDAKLLAAMAAFTGLAGVLPVLLLSLSAGGVLALGSRGWAAARHRTPQMTGIQRLDRTLSLPYSWAIAAGTLGYVLLVHLKLL
jgi:prepilin peptidase CpaA